MIFAAMGKYKDTTRKGLHLVDLATYVFHSHILFALAAHVYNLIHFLFNFSFKRFER